MATQTMQITKEDVQGVTLYKTNVSPISFGRSAKIERKEVKGVPGAFLLKDVLSKDECKQLIDFTEDLGYTEAPVTTHSGPVMMKDVRDNTRLLLEASPDLLDTIMERVKNFLPSEAQGRRGAGTLCGLNDRFRFYRYEPGQFFAPHYDGSFGRDDQISFLTFIVYLNDGFKGGHTTFFVNQKEYKVSPKAGTALLFYHGSSPLSPRHEGSCCEKGNKYAMRSDVMYKLK
ncbi:hypothetical protein PROFUN_05601 [Planoprotostelium fungivorum]|uniref:Fe2OG dioxygenase domain-containing protein n=1 Tax=Planoprotostelium fungivorum TaxID=1890364 RepID=A0A2P6N074_9EUKA|nr:hypothetical protein PROFUN_05601 [Planoprotostelium fungivorum]